MKKHVNGALTLDLLHQAVNNGDAEEIEKIFNDIHPEEPQVLCARLDHSIRLKRPSTEEQLEVHQPSLLIVACVGWFPEILALLMRMGADVNDSCEVVSYGQADSVIAKPISTFRVTALMLTAISGRLDHAKMLLSNGALVNTQDSSGCTALMSALREENTDILDLLLWAGASVEQATQNGVTPLMICAGGGHIESMRKLLNRGADVQKLDFNNRNALFYAVESPTRPREIYKHLINVGCCPTIDKFGINMVMRAAYLCDLDMLTYLLSNAGKAGMPDISSLDNQGQNALFHGCKGGNLSVVRFLVEHGKARAVTNRFDVTIIMIAASSGNLELLRYVVSRSNYLGVKLNEKDTLGRNSLFYVAEGGSMESYIYLRKAGLILERDSSQKTVLMHAVEWGSAILVQYILDTLHNNKQLDFDLSDKDGLGRDILFYAVKLGNIDLFYSIYSAGATPCVDKNGVNILMFSAQCGHVKMTAFLYENRETLGLEKLEDGALSAQDAEGRNILFYCIQGGQPPIMDFFLELVQPQSTPLGETLLMQAAEFGQANIMQKLINLKGIELDAIDYKGQNALFHGVRSGNIAILQLLLQRELKVVSDKEDTTLLMVSAAETQVASNENETDFNTNQQSRFEHNVQRQNILHFLIEHALRLNIDIHAVDSRGRNALFYAIDSGNTETLSKLKNSGIKPVTDDRGYTLLMAAAAKGNQSLIESLLSSYDVQKQFTWEWGARDIELGEDVYFVAFRARNFNLIKTLLHCRHPAPIPLNTNKSGQSLVALCFSEGRSEVARLILENQIEHSSNQIKNILNGHDASGCTVFHHFLAANDLKSLKKFAELFDLELDRANPNGCNFLLKALKAGASTEIIECILKIYPIGLLEDVDTVRGNSALHLASATGKFSNVKLLLSCGQRPTHLSHDGSSVLHAAIEGGNVKIFHHLLRYYKSDLYPFLQNTNAADRTIVLRICERGLSAFCKVLCTEYSETEFNKILQTEFECTTKEMKQSTLMLAASSGSTDLFALAEFKRFCINNETIVKYVDTKGRNALFYACDENVTANVAIVNSLLSAGMLVDDMDMDGMTPLMFAAQKCESLIVFEALLGKDISHGERSNRMMNQQKDILDRLLPNSRNAFDFCDEGNKEILKVFVQKEFGLTTGDERFLETMLDFDPASLELDDLFRTLVDRSLVLSGSNLETVLAQLPSKRQKWAQLVQYVARRGRGRLAELCSVLQTFDTDLTDQLNETLNPNEMEPDAF